MDRRKFLAIAGIMATLAGCAGDTAGGDDIDDTAPTDDGGGNDDSLGDDGDGSSDSPEPEQVESVVGSLVEGDNLHLVVEEYETTTQIGEFSEADPGNEFAVVRLAMKNISDEFVHVSQLLQASIRDDEEYSYSMAFAGTDEPTFNDGQFAPGEVERGSLVFELPEDATSRSLVFDLDYAIFGGIDRVEVDLENETDAYQLAQDLQIDLHAVGDAVDFSGVDVAVRDVRVESALGMFAEPDPGNEYVVVDIEVTNDTGEEQWISTILQMLVKDDDGWSYQEDWAAAAELDRAFDEGSALADGETRAGEVAYEIEEGLSPLYWVFEFTLWTEGDKTFWELR